MVILKLQVKAVGWCGFGISPNMSMVGADLIMAWFGGNDDVILKVIFKLNTIRYSNKIK